MSNQQFRIGLVALTLTAILVFATALPAVNALTPSTIYQRYSQKTALYPGGQNICGDHLCTSGDYYKMKKALDGAQRNPSACKELKEWLYCGQTNANMTISPNTQNW